MGVRVFLLAAASVTSALVVPGGALKRRTVRLSAEPPALAYAAEKTAEKEEVSEASFVGQFELEEREDADSSKTLMELTSDGKVNVGATDGIPYLDAVGRWEYDGKELILELTRGYEGTTEAYSVTRVFIGDVIALNEVPPQVSARAGADKTFARREITLASPYVGRDQDDPLPNERRHGPDSATRHARRRGRLLRRRQDSRGARGDVKTLESDAVRRADLYAAADSARQPRTWMLGVSKWDLRAPIPCPAGAVRGCRCRSRWPMRPCPAS